MSIPRRFLPAACVSLLSLSPTACSCGDADRAGGTTRPGDGDGGTMGENGGDGGGMSGNCLEGDTFCDGDIARVCSADGEFEEVDCATEGMECVPSSFSEITGEFLALGCVACRPGTGSCEGGVARHCPEDGSGFVRFECDPMQGMTCDPDGCKGRCALPEAQHSYIGCDYYPTVTLNPVWRGFDFAVSVANAGDAEANVIVTLGDEVMATTSVPAGGIEVITLPWNLSLKGEDVDACQRTPDPGASRLARAGAYRLRSDQPVTVHQFSPLSYQLTDDDGDAPAGCPRGVECAPAGTTDCLSYSNDASLLLPATSLTGDYTVLSWPSVANAASFYAITATEDGTDVTVTGSGEVEAGAGIRSDGSGSVRLDRGDVLQVVARHSRETNNPELDSDTTGTRIHASRPVQVVGGHSCALVPDVAAHECDHIEQALFPSQVLGDEYVVSYPAAVASRSPHVVRIAAIRPDTRVELDPPVLPAFTLSPDDPPRTVQVGAYPPADEDPPVDVHITASEPIAVAQYMQGQTSVPSGSGDPSMALSVPVAQYRTEYVFTAPSTYDTSFINIIGPADAQIMLDGARVTARAELVGAGPHAVFRVELDNASGASHTLESDRPVGLVVYGYGRFTSYMYPGGLDLRPITQIGPQ